MNRVMVRRSRPPGTQLADVLATFGLRVGDVLHPCATTQVVGEASAHVTVLSCGMRVCAVQWREIERLGAQRAGFDAANFAILGKDPEWLNKEIEKWML